ncbi:hypothetical protein [[Kitasatospora] papulosa]|uniref:hypothetical protein n=1 Tax=[Kitasatospora] papulosa TaxID=1464011 RepID=UPI0036B8F7A8
MSDSHATAASSSTEAAMPASRPRPSRTAAQRWGMAAEAERNEVLDDLVWLQRTREDRLRDQFL